MSTREHVNRSDCWCRPKLTLPCVICLGARGGCDACDDGFTEVDRETFDASELPGVAVHRDIKEDVK